MAQPPSLPDHLASFTDARMALDYLGAEYFGPNLSSCAEPIPANQVPAPFDALLVHQEHMTTSLERFHDRPVQLDVIEFRQTEDSYTRKILLSLANSDHVVEVGVVRIDLRFTSDAVREEILKREKPLGDILIRHNVLRKIEPRWFYRFDGPPPLLAAFDRPLNGPVYGRVGIIHCDGQPAIELLEVVSGDRAPG